MNMLALAVALIAAATDTTNSSRTGAATPSTAPVFSGGVLTPAHDDARYGGPPDTLALDWLEREALLRNPTLAARRAAAAQARARARVAGSLEDPMVDFGAAPRSFTDANTGPAAMGGAPGGTAPAYRFGVRQRVEIFGERGLERRSARAEAAATTLDAEAAQLDLLQEVRLAFFNLYRVERALESNAEQAVLLNQFRRVALSRYAAGAEGQQDPLDADSELGMLAHEKAMLLRERRVTGVRLNTLLHREPALPLPPSPRRLTLPALADTARAALAWRSPWPELRASDARIAAEEARLSLAWRRRLPVLELGLEHDRFMDEEERRTIATVGINLPIGRGRLAAAEDEARAALQRTRSERAAVADQVELRIEEARADLEESLHEVEVLESVVVPASERSLAAARAAYESGRGGFLSLMQSARRRAEARLTVEEARTRAARGWAALQRAVAGDGVTAEEHAASTGTDERREDKPAREAREKETRR